MYTFRQFLQWQDGPQPTYADAQTETDICRSELGKPQYRATIMHGAAASHAHFPPGCQSAETISSQQTELQQSKVCSAETGGRCRTRRWWQLSALCRQLYTVSLSATLRSDGQQSMQNFRDDSPPLRRHREFHYWKSPDVMSTCDNMWKWQATRQMRQCPAVLSELHTRLHCCQFCTHAQPHGESENISNKCTCSHMLAQKIRRNMIWYSVAYCTLKKLTRKS